MLPTYSPGIPRFKKEWKKRSYSANITFRPKGIVASTDANLVIDSDLDSDDEK